MVDCEDHPDAETYVEILDRTVAVETVVVERCVECGRFIERMDDGECGEDTEDDAPKRRDYFA